MAYFRNNAVNLLNLHYGIHSIALTGSGAFVAVFLLKAGVPAPVVLACIAAILWGRLLLRPLVLPLAKRFGVRPLLVAGTLGTACQYPVLAEVHGVGLALYAFCAVGSLADTFYWTTYHAYFASLGDAEHRGHQIGAREALSAVVGIIGPLATGWALTALGPRAAFWATAVVVTASALPLLWTPRVFVVQEAPGALRAATPGVLLFVADGWVTAGYLFVWQMALFISLGESFTAFGGALALAALLGAAAGLTLGRLIDRGHGPLAAWLSFGALGVVLVFRALSYGNATFAIFANACGALVSCLYIPTIMTAVYNRAKAAPCALRFHIATEGGWDLGGGAAALVGALLLELGAPMGAAILVALFGAMASFLLLRRHYAARAAH